MILRTSTLAVLWLLSSSGLCGQQIEMRPFSMEWKDNSSDVAASFLLNAPAGQDGFIRVKDGHLVRPDGRRFRMWGVNISPRLDADLKADAPAVAANLARFGVNSVRIWNLDNARGNLFDESRNDTRHLDAEKLGLLDFFIAELKKRGIYVYLCLNVCRQYKEGDGVPDWEYTGYAKALNYFDERVLMLHKEYARQLLTHYNPYTKSEYRNEPAILVVEMVNENSLLGNWKWSLLNGKNKTKPSGLDRVTWTDLTPHYAEELTQKYNAWLAKRLPAGDLTKLRAMAGVPENAPVPRLTTKEAASAPALRFQTEMAFYEDLESGFFRDMRAYLKEELGVKPLVIGTYASAAGGGYPLVRSELQLDIVDAHTYWQQPHTVRDKMTGKEIAAIKNTPMVNDPFHSTIMELSHSAVAGKPFTVSEINHFFPNEYACEGIPIMAAYAAFQDWDGVLWFNFGKPGIYPPRVTSLDLWSNPVKMPELLAGALTFLRPDVKAAAMTVARSYSKEQVYESMRLPGSEAPYFTPGFSLSIPLQHGSRIAGLDGPPTGKFDAHDANPLVSDTKELAWYHSGARQGLVTIETERSEALIGFVKANRKALRNLSADVRNDFCAITLTSLDGSPLSRSARLLLITAAKAGNTGMKWNGARTMLSESGTAPTRIEPVTGALTLMDLADAKRVEAVALDGAARPMGPARPARKTAAGWEIAIGDPATPWYVINVTR